MSDDMYIKLTVSRIMQTHTKPLTNEDRVILDMGAVTSPMLLGLLNYVYIYGLPTVVALASAVKKVVVIWRLLTVIKDGVKTLIVHKVFLSM